MPNPIGRVLGAADCCGIPCGTLVGMIEPDGLFDASEAVVDSRNLDEAQRVAVLDGTYNVVSLGQRWDLLSQCRRRGVDPVGCDLETFARGIWAATIVCAHGVCERTVAGS